MSQEVRETAAILLCSPREFPLSVRATLKRQFQIFTKKFTPLGTLNSSALSALTLDLRLSLDNATSPILTPSLHSTPPGCQCCGPHFAPPGNEHSRPCIQV